MNKDVYICIYIIMYTPCSGKEVATVFSA